MKHVVSSCLLWWRPKMILALLLGFAGAAWDVGHGAAVQASDAIELLTPRQIFARGLLLVTAIEAMWWVGRNAYDAYLRPDDEVMPEVGATLLEALVLYAGYLSILAVTTVIAGMLRDTAVAGFAEMLNLAFWAGIALIQLTRIAIHWKGSEDAARKFFGRIGDAFSSAKKGRVGEALQDTQRESS